MLGENHSLINEFPEHKSAIETLVTQDPKFASEMARYNELDTEIRELELNNSPTDDGVMHHKKQQRAALKDTLYRQLMAAK